MSEREVTLASGLSGSIRKWKMKDLAVFSDRKIVRKPGPAIEANLLKNAWVNTIDHGPYAFDGRPPWLGEILQGDLFDAIRWVRSISWGNDYAVDFRCENFVCGGRIPWLVHLSELPTVALSEEGQAALDDGNSIHWTFPECKRDITYQLPTGKSSVLADKLAKQHGRHLHVIWASRVTSVQGIDSAAGIVNFLGDLEGEDVQAIQDELDRLNPGVKTTVDLECPECDTEQQQDIRFGPDFFMPTRKKEEIGMRY